MDLPPPLCRVLGCPAGLFISCRSCCTLRNSAEQGWLLTAEHLRAPHRQKLLLQVLAAFSSKATSHPAPAELALESGAVGQPSRGCGADTPLRVPCCLGLPFAVLSRCCRLSRESETSLGNEEWERGQFSRVCFVRPVVCPSPAGCPGLALCSH